jgi:hypothetical protein
MERRKFTREFKPDTPHERHSGRHPFHHVGSVKMELCEFPAVFLFFVL